MDSLNNSTDDQHSNVPPSIWANYDPRLPDWQQVNNPKLNEQLQQALSLMCCPGIYSYHLVETATQQAFHVGGAVQHTYGLTDNEFLHCPPAELVRYKHPDDQLGYKRLVEKASEFGREHKLGRTLKRIYFYRQITSDQRIIQVMHQEQVLVYNEQGVPVTQLVVVVDMSHIRPLDARPMMTLLDMTDVVNPTFFTMTLEPLASSTTRCPLGVRELDVIRLLAEGKTSKQIAYALGISPNTVNNHRQHILGKMKAQSTAGAISAAIRKGCL